MSELVQDRKSFLKKWLLTDGMNKNNNITQRREEGGEKIRIIFESLPNSYCVHAAAGFHKQQGTKLG